MSAPAAPAAHRQWNTAQPLNHHSRDLHLESGVRISTPVYIDLSTSQRKDLLNAIRMKSTEQLEVSQPKSISGIAVSSYQAQQPQIEAYLGMTLDVLRTVIFQRGGIGIDLLLRMQSVAGIEYITQKDITKAFKARHDAIKAYSEEQTYAGSISAEAA